MTPERVADAYLEACLAELDALKPGNVHRFAAGHGMTVADFERSARVSAPAVARAGQGVGAAILDAVARTREAVGCNTNLGIILLCAPLAAAALSDGSGKLRERLAATLDALDVADAEAAFAAIRLAAPAGLGESRKHDVRDPAAVDLRAAMAEAAARDSIARQYASGFTEVFDLGLPCLKAALREGSETWAATAVYLRFLARLPDSHVARKQGEAAALALQERAVAVERRFAAATDPAALTEALLSFDAALKREGLNPGSSADLTVATLFAARLEAALEAAP